MDIKTIKKINGTYGKSSKEAYIDDIVKHYNIADENVITKFTALVNSNRGKETIRYRNSIETPIRVLMEYKNNKNTTNSNYYIEVSSGLNDVLNGDILIYHDKVANRQDTYLCLSKPMRKRDYDLNYVVNCNQTLNWKGLDKPIPCWCDNSSYGTKGVIDNNLIKEYDGKILFYTQFNEKTAQIKQDMRFIFDHNKDSVYTVVDINRVVTGNVLRLVMDKTEYQEGKDDLVNNIAYNECINDCIKEEPELGVYGIKSYTDSMEIKKWDINMFTIVDENGIDASGQWDFEINLNGNQANSVIINEKGNNYIKLSNNGYIGIDVELICTKDDIRLTQIIRLVR